MNPLPNPWVLLAVGIAWLASLAGVGWWQRHDGAATTEAKWLAVQSTERAQAAAALDKAHREARAAEQKAVTDAAADAVLYQKVIDDAHAQRDRDVAAARAGAIRLRVSGGCRAVQADGGGGPAPAAAGAGAHDAADAELPREVTEDLLGLADDADAVAQQLTAAQRRIEFDIAHCGQPVKPAP